VSEPAFEAPDNRPRFPQMVISKTVATGTSASTASSTSLPSTFSSFGFKMPMKFAPIGATTSFTSSFNNYAGFAK
jgi:hypothetical protein